MRWCLLFFLFSTQVWASDISLSLDASKGKLDKLISSLWQEIPYQYRWGKRDLSRIGDTVKAQLVKADIRLGNPGTPLASINIKADQRLQLRWKLGQIFTEALIKVRFKFRQYGLQVTHDEYFVIKARNIPQAITSFNVNLNQGRVSLDRISNKDFAFQNVQVKPRDGIGSVLRFIFDNVWSKDKVDRYLRDELNKELRSWINQNQMLTDLQQSLNKQLEQLEQNPLQLSQIASNLYVKINQLELNRESLKLGLNLDVDTSSYEVHPCATGMLNKNDAWVRTEVVENLLNNFATYQIQEDGKVLEPLFCFGYKDYDEQGNPMGEEATVDALGRTIRIKYWITPTRAPIYSYNQENNTISLDLDLRMDIQGKGYPHLKAVNDHLTARLIGSYQLELVPGKGLQLVFQEFSLPELRGQVKVKWFRFSPYFKIATSRIRKELEDSINRETRRSNAITHLVDEALLINNQKLFLNGYDLNEQGHYFHFGIE
jgi:hypothetical protein